MSEDKKLVWDDDPQSPFNKPLSLENHEARSQYRYDSLARRIESIKENKMSEGINTDKVIVNAGGGGEGMGGMAALVAALGNRNEGGDNAALIAALGNRNESAGLAPLFAAMSGGGFGGGNSLWPIILLALLGRRGLGGDDGGSCEDNIGRELIMSKLGSIEGAVPLIGSQVENSVCRAEGAITNTINQASLAQLAATSNVKDSVTNTATLLLGAGAQNAKEILGAICALSSKIDSNTILDLQRQLGVAQAATVEERNHSRVREVEVNVSQNVNQQQAQAQLQAQIGALIAGFSGLSAQVQRVRADQDIVNLGTMVASGTQATTSTQVR